MAKYHVLAVFLSRVFQEVGAEIDGITETMIEVSVVVVVLIIVSVLLWWCCCKAETHSTNYDVTGQLHVDERSHLINPQLVPGTSHQNFAEDGAVIQKVDKSDFPDAGHLLQKHRPFLRDRVDIDFGLLDLLLGSGILSYEALQRIKSRSPFQERNEILIDYITKHDGYQGLCLALKDAHQSHIVNFLEADGVYRRVFKGVWPLSERIVQAIDSNRHSLLDLIDSTELVHELFSKNVIGSRHCEAISSKPTSYEQNETLVDILRRKSMEEYSKAMKCFHATNQSHIVQALAEGGIIVRVHANLQGVEEVFETEKELVDKITHLLRYQTKTYVAYILQQLQLRLIGVSVGHSVVCHFHCPEVDYLKRLQDKLRSRELEKSLNTVFRNALPERHIDGVVITSVDDQYAEKTETGDSFQWSLERNASQSVYTADDIEASELYSILEKDFPARNHAWTSRRKSTSSKK